MSAKFEPFPKTGSWLERLDPRWKLAALVPAALATAFLRNWPVAAAALSAALLMAAAARLPVRWLLKRIGAAVLFVAPFAILLPFLHGEGPRWEIGPLRVSVQGLEAGLLILLKCVAIVTLMIILFAAAPLHVTLNAAQALRAPGLLVQLVMLTYRYIFVLGGELAHLRIALRVRGYRTRATAHCYRTVGHVAGTLLVRGAERAERVGQAMRCRGFDGRFHSLAEFRTNAADVAFFAANLVVWVTLLLVDSHGLAAR